jgi:uncharacterized protein
MANRTPWENRLALISGASNGLGRQIAKRLASQRARLLLVGRQADRLASLRDECSALGSPSVQCIELDVTSSTDTPHWGRLTSELEHSGLDLLVNAVGKSDRGELMQLSSQDLRSMLEINVIATHAMTQFCWSGLCRTQGVVVNIASLAGIVPGPAMGGYTMAKHALVGLHRQWRIEAREKGIHFLLVCPGPIERDDSQDRYKDLASSRGLDAQSAQPGGGVSLKRLDPVALSDSILRAACQRDLELILPGKARWLAALHALWPSLADRILVSKMNR